MAMCAGLDPPLGWVLSEQTRSKFDKILKDCGNREELTELKMALGLPPEIASVMAAKGAAR
jgi:hypothetical protein